MKHLLNNLTEQEKNAIREQHTGGMKLMTENFSRLLNSKLGDSKPLVSEQTSPYTVGQTINAIRSTDNKMYTLKITQVGKGFVVAVITGPGAYEGKDLRKGFQGELNSNRPGILAGNMEMGDFKPINEQTSPYTVGQTINAIRSTDNKMYTLKITQVGKGFVAAVITGPGTYERHDLRKGFQGELNSNRPGILAGNMEMGDFKIQ